MHHIIPQWGNNPITRGQIEFFRHNSDATVPSLAFVHVPLPEYRRIDSALVGEKHEVISAPNQKGVLYQLLVDRNVVSISAGHDHTNDFCGRLGNVGPALCYSGGSGYTAYGKKGFARRARVFVLTQKGGVYTYKRLDDANFTLLDKQTLKEDETFDKALP